MSTRRATSAMAAASWVLPTCTFLGDGTPCNPPRKLPQIRHSFPSVLHPQAACPAPSMSGRPGAKCRRPRVLDFRQNRRHLDDPKRTLRQPQPLISPTRVVRAMPPARLPWAYGERFMDAKLRIGRHCRCIGKGCVSATPFYLLAGCLWQALSLSNVGAFFFTRSGRGVLRPCSRRRCRVTRKPRRLQRRRCDHVSRAPHWSSSPQWRDRARCITLACRSTARAWDGTASWARRPSTSRLRPLLQPALRTRPETLR